MNAETVVRQGEGNQKQSFFHTVQFFIDFLTKATFSFGRLRYIQIGKLISCIDIPHSNIKKSFLYPKYDLK